MSRLSVHPRVGGEHGSYSGLSVAMSGSSPRGRGTRPTTRRGASRSRFIPAWAGNTNMTGDKRQDAAVHPRVGGEHNLYQGTVRSLNGSSPRGRGTHDRQMREYFVKRFIPAWAGNTEQIVLRTVRYSVHPRVGGEHYSRPRESLESDGSSPRGRGTHCAM